MILANSVVLYKIIKLNRGKRLRPSVLFLTALFLLLNLNRFVFIFDYTWSEVPHYYNFGNAQNSIPVITFVFRIIPVFLFSYITTILGFSYKRALYIGSPFIVIAFLGTIGIDTFIFSSNFDLFAALHIICGLAYSTFVMGYLYWERSKIPNLLFVWIIACVFAYLNVLIKVVTGILDIENYSPTIEAGHIIVANLILIFLDYGLVVKGERILSGDMRVEQKLRLESQVLADNDPTMRTYRDFRIWNLNSPLNVASNLSPTVKEKLESQKAQILYKIVRTEVDFIRKDKDYKFLQNPYYLSQELGLEANLIKQMFDSYCRFSYSEYTKLIRILKADYLIRGGFLNRSDVDALAERCYFNNRVTLYNNFKKFFGTSIAKHKARIKEQLLTTN